MLYIFYTNALKTKFEQWEHPSLWVSFKVTMTNYATVGFVRSGCIIQMSCCILEVHCRFRIPASQTLGRPYMLPRQRRSSTPPPENFLFGMCTRTHKNVCMNMHGLCINQPLSPKEIFRATGPYGSHSCAIHVILIFPWITHVQPFCYTVNHFQNKKNIYKTFMQTCHL